VVGGGETLQPVLYSLAVEKMFAGQRVEGGQLYYCTSTGGFEKRFVPLDERARRDARQVADTIGRALDGAFLPAAPKERGCEWCDYRSVCGPYEELRVSGKTRKNEDLERLVQLRALR